MGERTQKINYGNAIALPVLVGAAHTPVDGNTKVANELFPERVFGRIGAMVKNNSAANSVTITAPSGMAYVLDAGQTLNIQQGFFLEDGAYTITGTAAQTFSFWEAY